MTLPMAAASPWWSDSTAGRLATSLSSFSATAASSASNPGVLAALAAERRRDPDLARVLDPFVRERTRPLVESMQRAVARGEIPPTVDLDLAASLTGGPILTRVLFGGATDPDVVRSLVGLVVRALQGSRAGHGPC